MQRRPATLGTWRGTPAAAPRAALPRILSAFLLALLLCTPLRPAHAQTPDPQAVRQVVLDIISFTRWPQPRPTLRLCVVGPAASADALFAQPAAIGPVPVTLQRAQVNEEQLGPSCDIVYEGPLTPTEREQVLRRIAGHPILTIGEAAPGCIETTMFCLSRSPQSMFSTNLDAISRSGVRLNPRVLLLGRRGAATPSGAATPGGAAVP